MRKINNETMLGNEAERNPNHDFTTKLSKRTCWKEQSLDVLSETKSFFRSIESFSPGNRNKKLMN